VDLAFQSAIDSGATLGIASLLAYLTSRRATATYVSRRAT